MPRTAKNKANTTTSPSPTKKWKWTPGLGSVVTSSTSGTRTRNMILDLVETCVDGVFIGICTKAWEPDETAYLFPMEKGLNDTKDGGDLAKDWKYVYSFFPRRDTDIDDGITPMKTKKGSKWDWKVVLLLIDEEDDTSIKKAGHHIAHCFSKFTRNKNVMEKTESYTYNKCIRNNPQALNHYLLDLDVTKVLKSLVCHEGSEYASKEDVLQDNEVMEAFFGTSDVGRAYLEDMKEEDWDYLLDGTDN